jgi:putative heme-binding domain-containing protein
MKSAPMLLLVAALPVLAADPRGDHPDAPPSTPEQQLTQFHLPPGFEIQLVASEPEIQKPLNLTFDAAGRLWVTGTEMYPWPAGTDAQGKPIPNFHQAYDELTGAFGVRDSAPPPALAARDTVRILSDFDASGRAQKIISFADRLNIPSGVQPLPRKPTAKGDTAIVYSIPNIYQLEDTDGDGRADRRQVLYGTAGFIDTHGGMSSFLYGIDGWVYGTHGFRNHSTLHDSSGRVTVLDSGNTYRFRPDGSQFEIFAHGQTNPFGLTADPRGNLYSADSHSKPVYLLLRGAFYEGLGKQHDGLGFAPRITEDDHGSTAIAGISHYSATTFPSEYHDNLFNGNPVTQRINRAKLEWHGSTPQAIRQPDFLTCDDPWFRPVQVKLGPDGALYIADFYNSIIGHYEFPLADPRRDRTHGRIWRIVWKGSSNEPALPLPNLSQLTATQLIEKLADPNRIIRTLATHELVDRAAATGTEQLLSALADTRVPSGPARDHLLWASERLGLLTGPTREPEVLAALEPNRGSLVQICKILAERPRLSLAQQQFLKSAVRSLDGNLARAAADALGRHPNDAIEVVATRMIQAPAEDSELIHTLRMTLRDSLKVPNHYAKAVELIPDHPAVAAAIAEALLGLPTAEAAAYQLKVLQRNLPTYERSDEWVRHIALYLPAEQMDALGELLESSAATPYPVQLGLAENLAQAFRQRSLALPERVAAWSGRILLEGLQAADPAVVARAIEGLRETPAATKLEPLAKLADDATKDLTLRGAALDALANADGSAPILARCLQESSSPTLRKRAALLLSQHTQSYAAPLLAALPTAPHDLASTLAARLAQTDGTCDELLIQIEQGKAAASLLKTSEVATALGQRSSSLQARAAALTQGLPPEDARLAQLIEQRVAGFHTASADPTRGAQVFALQCAVCHRLQGEGTAIGPALEGIGNRGLHRLAEDILDPNRNVDPIFRQTVLSTREGHTLAGVNLQEQGDLLVLTDASGKTVSTPSVAVISRITSPLSLMPATFENALSVAEFNDLLAYLLDRRDK